MSAPIRWTSARMLACVYAGMLSGCAVGPDYRAPDPPATTRYVPEPAAPPAGMQRLASGGDVPAEWWRMFGSTGLDALMQQALAANPDLQAAQAALRAARESVLAQRAAFFPSVDAQYGAIRQGVAQAVASPLASGADTYTLHTVQLSVGYVPDVFGANQRQVESLDAQADAQRHQREAVRLTLETNLVAAVIQRASIQAQIDATRGLVALATRQLALTRRAHALGQSGNADVAAQEMALAQADATLPPLDQQLAQCDDQIAVLAGTTPDTPSAPIALDALALPGELPVSLPARLAEQRPDIRIAEAQLHAASAQIGVAVAARLPNIELTAGLGSSALRLSALAGAGTGFWSLTAGVAQPLFDAGMLRHRQLAAEAAYDQAAAQYRSTVLTAFRNVADVLHAIETDTRQLDAVRAGEQAALHSLEIVRREQAAGAAGTPAVLAAEQASEQAKLARIQAHAARLADSAALIEALGGGWWNRAASSD